MDCRDTDADDPVGRWLGNLRKEIGQEMMVLMLQAVEGAVQQAAIAAAESCVERLLQEFCNGPPGGGAFSTDVASSGHLQRPVALACSGVHASRRITPQSGSQPGGSPRHSAGAFTAAVAGGHTEPLVPLVLHPCSGSSGEVAALEEREAADPRDGGSTTAGSLVLSDETSPQRLLEPVKLCEEGEDVVLDEDSNDFISASFEAFDILTKEKEASQRLMKRLEEEKIRTEEREREEEEAAVATSYPGRPEFHARELHRGRLRKSWREQLQATPRPAGSGAGAGAGGGGGGEEEEEKRHPARPSSENADGDASSAPPNGRGANLCHGCKEFKDRGRLGADAAWYCLGCWNSFKTAEKIRVLKARMSERGLPGKV